MKMSVLEQGRTRKRGAGSVFSFLYFIAYAFLYTGWLFHRSPEPQVFIYSTPHAFFLLLMASLFFLPLVLRPLFRKGGKQILFVLAPAVLLGLIFYFFNSVSYTWRQRHLFDPYLQAPPVQFVNTVKAGGVYRILFLGGSSTQCEALLPDQRYPETVDRLLRERFPEIKIEILNAGLAWYTAKHSLINYVTYYEAWQPDLVIVMHSMNDLYRSFSPPEYAAGDYNKLWSHFYGPSIHGALPPPYEKHLWEKLRSVSFLGFPVKRITENWYSIFRYKEVDYPLSRYYSAPDFERYLGSLVRNILKHSQAVILSEPSLYKEVMSREESKALRFPKEVCALPLPFGGREYASADSVHRAMRAFNGAAGKIAQDEGAVFLDAAEQMPRDLKYFIDDIHYTAEGAERLAQIVVQGIIEKGLIQEKTVLEHLSPHHDNKGGLTALSR